MNKTELINATFKNEVQKGERFEFGRNWRNFLSTLTEEKIQHAQRSLREMLEIDDLSGKKFLDVGSGSGLFSLVAKRLGAEVHSFDYDPQSVMCTQELKDRFFPGDVNWKIEQGSALDLDFIRSLGRFDIVYSWGVLHHTGDMWKALDNVILPLSESGKLYIAIYNDVGVSSHKWLRIKRTYNKMPFLLRKCMEWFFYVRLFGKETMKEFILLKPFYSWRKYSLNRGMTKYYDFIDWLGGYPFEFAKPEEIFEFYKKRGFELTRLITCAGTHGCNSFVFSRSKTC